MYSSSMIIYKYQQYAWVQIMEHGHSQQSWMQGEKKQFSLFVLTACCKKVLIRGPLDGGLSDKFCEYFHQYQIQTKSCFQRYLTQTLSPYFSFESFFFSLSFGPASKVPKLTHYGLVQFHPRAQAMNTSRLWPYRLVLVSYFENNPVYLWSSGVSV